MKATWSCLGALLWTGVLAYSAQASYPYYPPGRPQFIAPGTCGPGYYSVNAEGGVYGPNYWLQPGIQPWNGFHPSFGCAPQPPRPVTFPTHPFARSPRDFFMVDP
jgi:hypothetical protein